MKKYAVVLLFIVGLSVISFLSRNSGVCPLTAKAKADNARVDVRPTGAVEQKQALMSFPSQVIVYYFHGNFRCTSCAQIERYTREAVESGFADQVKSGLVVFKVVNVEKSANEHFVQDYQLYTKSVVLSLVKDGKETKSMNLDKVWEYLRDRKKFDDYIRSGVSEYLEALQ